MSDLHSFLKPIPPRLRSKPVQNGYPVPWFVAEVDGVFDFRVADESKLKKAIKQRLCWICGQRLGAYLAFPIGPMCVINRSISDPPSHTECAEWSIKACPFLSQKQDFRRESNLPSCAKEPGGIAIKAQPGVVCLWITNKYEVLRLPNGLLFKIGDPLEVRWYKEARLASREEVVESINTGYGILHSAAELEGTYAIAELEKLKTNVLENLIPEC